MKITSFLLVTFLATIFKISAQTAGDYRSIASGNWNDATKWENYNGSNWVSATSYPGQNAGTGAVTVAAAHEIVLTAGVPYPIASLVIDQLEYYDAVGNKA